MYHLRELSKEKFAKLLPDRYGNVNLEDMEFYYSYKETLGNFKVVVIFDEISGELYAGVSKRMVADKPNRRRGLSIAACRALNSFLGKSQNAHQKKEKS